MNGRQQMFLRSHLKAPAKARDVHCGAAHVSTQINVITFHLLLLFLVLFRLILLINRFTSAENEIIILR